MLPRDPQKRERALAEKPRLDLPRRKAYPEPGTPRTEPMEQGPNEQSIVASGMTVEEWQLKHPGQSMGPAPEDVGQVTTDPPDGSDPEPDPLFPGTFSSVDPDGSKTRAENEDPIFPGDGSLVPDGGELPEQGTLVIQTPTEGSTVAAVHDIAGAGAVADATVELWASDRLDSPASTTTAGPNGVWGFVGDTPAHPGPITWTVRDGTSEASVSITVEEGGARMGENEDEGLETPATPEGDRDREAGIEPEHRGDRIEGEGEEDETPWNSMNRHADIDEFIETEQIETPEGWEKLTVAQKKAWLDEQSQDV